MRNIQLQHSDYDSISHEKWTDEMPGYLITPKIVLTTNSTGIWLYCFDEEIEEQATKVIAEQAKIIQLDVEGASVENIKLSTLAQMSLIDLAETLAAWYTG